MQKNIRSSAQTKGEGSGFVGFSQVGQIRICRLFLWYPIHQEIAVGCYDRGVQTLNEIQICLAERLVGFFRLAGLVLTREGVRVIIQPENIERTVFDDVGINAGLLRSQRQQHASWTRDFFDLAVLLRDVLADLPVDHAVNISLGRQADEVMDALQRIPLRHHSALFFKFFVILAERVDQHFNPSRYFATSITPPIMCGR